MRYEFSAARVQFEADLDGLLKAIREAHSADCRSPVVRKHVLCSAILLGSAALETYLETVLSAWSTLVVSSGKPTNVLPATLRAFLFGDSGLVAAFRHYIAFNDEPEFLDRLAEWLSRPSAQLANRSASIPAFPRQAVLRDRKYPSVDNLERLFMRLGVSKIFNHLNRSARADLKLSLRSFGDVRTELAHSGIPIGINAGDVRQRLREVGRVVKHLDRVLHRQICATTGTDTWPSPASAGPPLIPAA